MSTIENSTLTPGPWIALGRFALVLVGVQALRALVAAPLWAWVRPGDDPVLWQAISAASLCVAGVLLLLWRRPSRAELGLDWRGLSRWACIGYLTAGGLVFFLVLLTLLLDTGVGIANLHAALIVPAFEELLFRGYGWNRLRRSFAMNYGGFWTLLCITGLFGLWHLGYVDHLLRIQPYQHPAPALATLLLWKVAVGLAVGVLAGLVRWRTGRVYGSFLIHALWNLFGR